MKLRDFTEIGPNRQYPNDTVIWKLKIRAQLSKLIRYRAKRNYDVDDVRVQTVLAAVHINPHISTREIAGQTAIPQTTVVRILKKKSYHSYHTTLQHSF